MRKRKIRLLAGLICMVLIFFDIIPTGFQVSANEVEQEDSDANADDLGEEGALEDELTENDGEGADSGELDTENGTNSYNPKNTLLLMLLNEITCLSQSKI